MFIISQEEIERVSARLQYVANHGDIARITLEDLRSLNRYRLALVEALEANHRVTREIIARGAPDGQILKRYITDADHLANNVLPPGGPQK